MAIGNTAVLTGTDLKSCRQQVCAHLQLMPLSMVGTGEKALVKSINGKDETRRFLCNLGFVEDAEVTVISEISDNVIVNIKDTRMAISKSMASRIMIMQNS